MRGHNVSKKTKTKNRIVYPPFQIRSLTWASSWMNLFLGGMAIGFGFQKTTPREAVGWPRSGSIGRGAAPALHARRVGLLAAD